MRSLPPVERAPRNRTVAASAGSNRHPGRPSRQLLVPIRHQPRNLAHHTPLWIHQFLSGRQETGPHAQYSIDARPAGAPMAATKAGRPTQYDTTTGPQLDTKVHRMADDFQGPPFGDRTHDPPHDTLHRSLRRLLGEEKETAVAQLEWKTRCARGHVQPSMQQPQMPLEVPQTNPTSSAQARGP